MLKAFKLNKIIPNFIKHALKKIIYCFVFNAKVSSKAMVPLETKIGKGSEIGKGVDLGDGIEIQDNVKINDDVCLSSNSRIGKHCNIGENVFINASRFELGDFSLIYSNCYFDNKQLSSIVIGKFCQIATGCEMRNAEHDIRHLSAYPFYRKFGENDSDWKKDYVIKGDILIGNDVWIGHNAIIVAGVNIGNGAIIGAGAVVTRDVENYAVVGGVPAKIIKYRFTKEKIDQLLKIQWWNWSEQKIKKHFHLFYNDFTQAEIPLELTCCR